MITPLDNLIRPRQNKNEAVPPGWTAVEVPLREHTKPGLLGKILRREEPKQLYRVHTDTEIRYQHRYIIKNETTGDELALEIRCELTCRPENAPFLAAKLTEGEEPMAQAFNNILSAGLDHFRRYLPKTGDYPIADLYEQNQRCQEATAALVQRETHLECKVEVLWPGSLGEDLTFSESGLQVHPKDSADIVRLSYELVLRPDPRSLKYAAAGLANKTALRQEIARRVQKQAGELGLHKLNTLSKRELETALHGAVEYVSGPYQFNIFRFLAEASFDGKADRQKQFSHEGKYGLRLWSPPLQITHKGMILLEDLAKFRGTRIDASGLDGWLRRTLNEISERELLKHQYVEVFDSFSTIEDKLRLLLAQELDAIGYQLEQYSAEPNFNIDLSVNSSFKNEFGTTDENVKIALEVNLVGRITDYSKLSRYLNRETMEAAKGKLEIGPTHIEPDVRAAIAAYLRDIAPDEFYFAADSDSAPASASRKNQRIEELREGIARLLKEKFGVTVAALAINQIETPLVKRVKGLAGKTKWPDVVIKSDEGKPLRLAVVYVIRSVPFAHWTRFLSQQWESVEAEISAIDSYIKEMCTNTMNGNFSHKEWREALKYEKSRRKGDQSTPPSDPDLRAIYLTLQKWVLDRFGLSVEFAIANVEDVERGRLVDIQTEDNYEQLETLTKRLANLRKMLKDHEEKGEFEEAEELASKIFTLEAQLGTDGGEALVDAHIRGHQLQKLLSLQKKAVDSLEETEDADDAERADGWERRANNAREEVRAALEKKVDTPRLNEASGATPPPNRDDSAQTPPAAREQKPARDAQTPPAQP